MNPMTRRLLGAALPLTLALGLAACGDDDDSDRSGSDPTSQTPAPPPDGTDGATEGPSDNTSEAPSETTAPTAPATGLAAHLLDVGDVPADLGEWRVESTEAGDNDTVGDCQQFSFSDIGATESIEREFDGSGADAEQVVAKFADEKTAWRAQQVLLSWREECAQRLTADEPDEPATVSDLTEIDGADRFAGYYTVTTGTASDQESEIVAISQRGNLLSLGVVEFDGAIDAADAAIGEWMATASLAKL